METKTPKTDEVLPKHKSPNLTRRLLSEMTVPTQGINMIYVSSWWTVTPEEEILFYRNLSAQCNTNERVAKKLQERSYPECTCRCIPHVYVPVDPNDY